jgi:predicted nuclease of predicted toxin-antitoxin system
MLKSTANDLRLILDENISPNIVPRLWDAGIDVTHVRDRAMLRASDHKVLQFAQGESRAVATIDEADFEKLVKKMPTHCGIVVVPSGGRRDEQYEYVMEIAKFLRQSPNAMLAARDRITTVNEEMKVSARLAVAPQVPISIVRPSSA